MDWIFIITGMAVATLVTMTGIGGGSLMTPILIFGCGLPPINAVGTDLLYAALTKSGALLSYTCDRQIHWAATGWMLTGGVPAVVLANLILSFFHGAILQNRITDHAVGLVLALSVLGMLFPRRFNHGKRLFSAKRTWLVIGGFSMAFLVTLTSIGAGTLASALLMRLYPKHSQGEIVGTELAMAIPMAAMAASGHILSGQVDWPAVVYLSLGSLPGIWLGRHLVHCLPERWLRISLATVLASASIKLII